jgi:hypothetical protein
MDYTINLLLDTLKINKSVVRCGPLTAQSVGQVPEIKNRTGSRRILPHFCASYIRAGSKS